MAKKHDNEFKSMIVELLRSGSRPKQLGEEYGLNLGMVTKRDSVEKGRPTSVFGFAKASRIDFSILIRQEKSPVKRLILIRFLGINVLCNGYYC